ncbi:MAG: MarC family protein [Dehalococcoidia bacterium]|nr:MarC family protein [Dehalococcoidia bacterium]
MDQYSWAEQFVRVFVPLFVAIDAIGNIPVVLSLSSDMPRADKRKMLNVATATAGIVGLVFLFLGQLILDAMGISIGSFAIAGGIVLLVISLKLMMTGHFVDAVKEEVMAIVPIGTPLTVGPATITTLLLLANDYPLYLVLLGFALNILIVWISFLFSERIQAILGQGGIKAVSRVFSLLLAAIAVSMITRGLDLLGIITLAK